MIELDRLTAIVAALDAEYPYDIGEMRPAEIAAAILAAIEGTEKFVHPKLGQAPARGWPQPPVVVKFSADATPEEVDTARGQIESLRAPLDVERLAKLLEAHPVTLRRVGETARGRPTYRHDYEAQAIAIAAAYDATDGGLVTPPSLRETFGLDDPA